MKIAISSRWLARWIYQVVVYLYPPRFRREFGAQMRQDFALMYRSSRQQPTWPQRAAFWVLIGRDVIASLWREYRALLPAPRRWWWLRLVGLLSIAIGLFWAATFIELTTDAWLLPDRYTLEWWVVCMPLSTVAAALPLSFGLWTLPGRRRQRLVRGLSVLLAVTEVVPDVLQFIWRHLIPSKQRFIEPLLGAWDLAVHSLLFTISLVAILILSGISLRTTSHRWWSIAMLLIYGAPILTSRIARAIGYLPSVAEDFTGYVDALAILRLTFMLTALGWIFLGIKLWMSVPQRTRPGQIAATE